MKAECCYSVQSYLANHSFDILVISRSLGWTRSSQSNTAVGISERAFGQSTESNKSLYGDYSVPGSRRVGMRTIRKVRGGGEKDRSLEEIEPEWKQGRGNLRYIYTRRMITDRCSHWLSGTEQAFENRLNGDRTSHLTKAPGFGTRIRHVRSSHLPW